MTLSAGVIAVDGRGRQHGVPRAAAACSAGNVWVHVSGLDRFVDVEESAALLTAALTTGAPPPLRCDVAAFADDDAPPYAERRRRDQGKCHQGWALLQFADEAAAAAAAAALQGLRLGVARLTAAPARSRAELSATAQAAADAQAAAAAAARERQRAHNQRRRLRCRARGTAAVESLLSALPPPGGLTAAARFVSMDALHTRRALPPAIDWEAVPTAARPDAVLSEEAAVPAPAGATPAAQAARVARKRAQVASFAAVLRHMLAADGADGSSSAAPLTVVDFGCGSGGLTLPLAALFPACNFVGVDMLAKSVDLLRARAETAGLRNVTGVVGMIERYTGPVDVALGLHACGNATDFVIEHARRAGAAFLVCPCCIGKLRFGIAGGSSFSAQMRELPSLRKQRETEPAADDADAAQLPPLTHPRSQWMAAALRAAAADSSSGGGEGDAASSCDAAFAAIASAADVSHGEADAAAAVAAGFDEAGHGAVARVAKLNIEVDRAEGAREAGFVVAMLKLLDAAATAKNDLLAGAPRAARPSWAAALEALAAAVEDEALDAASG